MVVMDWVLDQLREAGQRALCGRGLHDPGGYIELDKGEPSAVIYRCKRLRCGAVLAEIPIPRRPEPLRSHPTSAPRNRPATGSAIGRVALVRRPAMAGGGSAVGADAVQRDGRNTAPAGGETPGSFSGGGS